MDYHTNLPFNPHPSFKLHLDVNSCFATIEQQANPLLRGKPIAVAAYNRPTCCILAPSVEAKKLGIRTGTLVLEAKRIYPSIIILEPDSEKYRFVHQSLKDLLDHYCEKVIPKSIDEFVLDFADHRSPDLFKVAKDIKTDLKQKIGDHLTISVGIGPNRFLAKTAAGLKKPDGLDEINVKNYLKIYEHLILTDLCGINVRNQYRLNAVNINSVLDFYHAPYSQIFSAFKSVGAQEWFLRLRGYEVDEKTTKRGSYGHSYVIPDPVFKDQALSIIQKLTHKAATRLREAGYSTAAVSLAIFYKDKTFWHKDHTLSQPLFSTRKIFYEISHLFSPAPDKLIKSVALTCHRLVSSESLQLSLFENTIKEHKLSEVTDQINQVWGDFTLTPARMITAKNEVPDRIAFGHPRH